jgi:hypothetical protein
MVKRYLAMRAQRDLDKRALMEGRGWVNDQLAELERLRQADRRAEDAEFKAADLERRLEEVSGKLAEESARADSADARWNIVLDEKQARIVELENEKIERLSGGRIKLTTPLRAKVPAAWPVSINGRAG